MTMKLLNRDQVLSAKDMFWEDIPTPEWAPEGTPSDEAAEFGVRIRNLTGEGRGVFIQRTVDLRLALKAVSEGTEIPTKSTDIDYQIETMLVAMTAIDDEGKSLFTEADVAALGQKNANPIARLAAVAQRLSALDKRAVDLATKK